MDSNESVKFCVCCPVSEVEEFVISISVIGVSTCCSLQCGSMLQDENFAAMQNLLFDNAAVNFCHTKK